MPWRTVSPAALALLPSLLTLLAPATAQPRKAKTPPETATAREQARLCERLSGMPAVDACRAALALPISPERRPAIRELLARQLVTLERWDELADLYREQVRLDPNDAAAWQRLGSTLLYALGLPAEAIGALQQAVRLAPDAEGELALAVALATVRRSAEAVAAFEAALRLDPHVLEGRPASRDLFEAARQGRPWP